MLLDKNGNKIATDKEKTLCTITFVYTLKEAANSTPKRETVFAWIQEGCTNKDCVSLFEPKGSILKSNCIIHDIIVLPIETVTHED